MVKDTAEFRYAYNHSPEDIQDNLFYDRLARLVALLG